MMSGEDTHDQTKNQSLNNPALFSSLSNEMTTAEKSFCQDLKDVLGNTDNIDKDLI